MSLNKKIIVEIRVLYGWIRPSKVKGAKSGNIYHILEGKGMVVACPV